MTFTTSIKEEMTHAESNRIEAICELSSFIRFNSKITNSKIEITIENASVARHIYKLIKSAFNLNAKIIYRTQKQFRLKKIYILELHKDLDKILNKLEIYNNNEKSLPNEYFLSSQEEKSSFLRGLFLATGSINDPKNNWYHMEFVVDSEESATYITKLLLDFSIEAKILKRTSHYMVYIKSAEMISDFLKIIGTMNALFYFEDIRIYRDHKNMINRLNNCEIANQEKIIKTGLKQLVEIDYILEHDLIGLLDERTKEALEYRMKYPEVSFAELAEIISSETGKKVGKSGINHYFIKIKNLVKTHQDKE